MAQRKRTQKQKQFRIVDVIAEAERIASEARETSVAIDWSESAKTPLEAEIRMKLIRTIELQEFAQRRSASVPLP